MRSTCLTLAAVLLLGLCSAAQDTPAPASETVFESGPLLPEGGFEKAAADAPDQPDGWHSDAPAEAWRIDRKMFLQGTGALRLAGGTSVAVVSEPIVLDEDFTGLNAVAMGHGTGGTAKIQWLARDGSVVRQDPLRPLETPDAGGWLRHTLGETARPEKADRVVCVLEANAPAGESFYWDAVEITGAFERVPNAVVLVNQAGYESFAPKRFVVSSNVQVSGATFRVDRQDGRTVLQGSLEDSSRIAGMDGADWGRYFYRGDFTPLNEDGDYVIHVTLGSLEASSPGFPLRFDQLWNNTFNAAVKALAACRNEGAGPLWNDPGKPVLPDAEAFWELVAGWSAVQWKLRLLGGVAPLTEELRWAAPRAVSRAEGADAQTLPCWAAALARYALLEKGESAVTEAARKAVSTLKSSGGRGPLAFSAAWDLYAAGSDPAWKEQARAWFPGVNVEAIEPLLEYEGEEGGAISMEIARSMEEVAGVLLNRSKNPFGVYATGDKGSVCYFLPAATETAGTPEGMGNTHRVLMAAELMAKAYRFASKPEYLAFVYDQFNWVFGCNPAGVCLMEGVGTAHVAKLAGPGTDRRESLTGVILNGIGPVAPGDDRPFVAVRESETATEATNGFALRNNFRFIGAMTQLKRVRTVQPQDKEPK